MVDRDYNAFLAEIRAATDLVSVVSENVSLRRAGRRHKGLCPFHDEKTPSFTVDGERGLFYCFGCSAGGDLFKYVMMRDGVEFGEAARLLGERIGLRPPERQGPASGLRRQVLEANAAALSFYRARLADPVEGGAARTYLEGRGLGPETIEEFEIGLAPDAWDRLRQHLAAVGVPEAVSLKAGLLAEPAEGRRGAYDRFRNRIIFPIRNAAGELVAFGGRALAADTPAKYLNSPESPVYVKGEVLYGMDRARGAIRDRGFAILVEGYMDLVGLAAGGFRNVAATLGTALTVSQARLLRRHTDRVVIAYDPDAAGRNATLRALEIFLGLEFRATVLRLPEGIDPDDFVRQRGSEAFLAALKGSVPAVEFLADHFAAAADLRTPRGRADGVRALLPFLARLRSPIERAGHVELIARRFGVDDDLMRLELREALKEGRRSLPEGGRPRRAPAAPAAVMPAVVRLVGILAARPELREPVLRDLRPEDLEGSPAAPILEAMAGQAAAAEELAGRVPEGPARELLTRAVVGLEEEGTLEDALACLHALRKARLQEESRRIQQALDAGADPAGIEQLLQRKQEVGRQINALS